MDRILIYNRQVYETIGFQEYIESEEYKPSPYVIWETVDGINLLYNIFTYEMLALSEGDYEKNKKYLVRHWFLFPKNIDPYSMCYSFKKIIRKTRKREFINKITDYTILTTTNCNARCKYCYEFEYRKRDMTKETAKDIGEYILRNSGDNVVLRWFGGEPLCNSSVIDIICGILKENKKQFSSTMVSNGFKFDEFNIETIRDIWKIRNVQITLDGTRENYNKTKNYKVVESNPFSKVLKNIEYLVSNNVPVNVRINISKNNIEDLHKLVDLLYEKFHKYKIFSAYSRCLFEGFGIDAQKLTKEEKKMVTDGYMSIQKHLKNCGLSRDYPLTNLRIVSNCMADNMKSVVINPDGKIGLCEHYIDSEFIGDIYQDKLDNDKIMEWQKLYVISECKTCPFFPQCTKIAKCPVGKCDEEWRKHLEFQIRNSMKKAYKNEGGF